MQIHTAAASGNLTSLQRQLDRGVLVDTRCCGGETPLMHACESTAANDEAMRMLLDAGADPNAVCQSLSYPPLMKVRGKHPLSKIRSLIDAGADAAYAAPCGYNALYKFLHSDSREDLPTIELLIQNGCDPNLVSSYGESPLQVAVTRARPKDRRKADRTRRRSISGGTVFPWMGSAAWFAGGRHKASTRWGGS